jgi:multidrug efflux pump subunit AcrB
MWIVRLALRRPYTFVVAAMLVCILGIVAILSMPTDIFPAINIPVISVIFNYTGMAPSDMERRIVTPYEQILTTTVNDIDHVESQSLYGVSVTKIYLQPNANLAAATAQVTAVSQTAIRQMPNGTLPPLIIQYNASSVPILQLSISSDVLPEQSLFDLAVKRIRPALVTIPGVQCPFPYGGKQRQVMVDLDPDRLYAYGISPAAVSAAINQQNLILPAGTAKIGTQEDEIVLNASPSVVDQLNRLPITSVGGTTVTIGDVSSVRDGFSVQTNIVHANAKRGVLLSILKSGNASTLDVVNAVTKALPGILATIPNGQTLHVVPMFDQSIFVRGAVMGVVKEAAIAAGLTALMILLFLGSWRSTLIVMISIPLSILVSIIILYFLGQTLNTMTLGGMALAVGILVDDATVEIENIHRNLHQRKRLVKAILDGAQQIAVPAFVSTLCICIVFVPVVFISGAAKFLFTPLAMSVVFAMMTSYLLSRTLVPTMVHYLLAAEVEMYGGVFDADDPHAIKAREHQLHRNGRSWLKPLLWLSVLALVALLFGAELFVRVMGLDQTRPAVADVVHDAAGGVLFAGALVLLAMLVIQLNVGFNRQFERLRRVYGGFLAWALSHRGFVVVGFALLVLASCSLAFFVGTDFFPTVDAGLLRLHVRCPPGTRIEQTEQYFAQVEGVIAQDIPQSQIAAVIDNMGIPNSGINLSLSDGTLMSPADGEILISLKEGHSPTAAFMRKLRADLPPRFPELTFFFSPADIVTQVLNFGLSAPVDVQITTGVLADTDHNFAMAGEMAHDLSAVPGVVDVHLQQVSRTPDLHVDVDRTFSSQVGVTENDVASNLLISLSSSGQVAPNFWLDPNNGYSYSIYVQTPQYKLDSIGDLDNTPVLPASAVNSPANTQLLSNLAGTHPGFSPTNVTHNNNQPTFDVLMSVQGTDLGSAAAKINQIVNRYISDPAKKTRGTTIVLRGQVQSMHDSFTGLGLGLIFAIVLVYLLMVINFQSWIDPLIILMALPGALSGILWMLWATGTTISVPSLMGAIMSIGVATANSILMITFANDQRSVGMNAHDAALSAGLTRLRPVMMTALAMIIGMLPMSLGLGEGGEQNAPLGRAVIGGLLLATVATLLFVPVVYSLLRQKAPITHVEKELM